MMLLDPNNDQSANMLLELSFFWSLLGSSSVIIAMVHKPL